MALNIPRDEPCALCEGRTHGLCSSASPQELSAFQRVKGVVRVLPPHTVLYAQNDPATDYFVLLDGWVGRSILLETGERQILDFALRGSFLGFQSDPAAPHDHTATCLSTARVCTVPRHRMEALLATDGQLAVCLAQLLAHEAARAGDHLVNIGLRAARERIAHLLLELFYRVRHHLPDASGDWARLPLTQGQLGEALALTSVHVSRTLRILREQQVLSFADFRLTVLDPASLLRAAGIENGGDAALRAAPSLPRGWQDLPAEKIPA